MQQQLPMKYEVLQETFTEFNAAPPQLNNYLKTAVWSHVGDSIVSSSEDKAIRVFSLSRETFNQIWEDHTDSFKQSQLGNARIIHEQNHINDISLYALFAQDDSIVVVVAGKR